MNFLTYHKQLVLQIPRTARFSKQQATSNNQEISFTINAMHFSNEAIAALNTGDVQGIYATNDAVITITQASRRKIK